MMCRVGVYIEYICLIYYSPFSALICSRSVYNTTGEHASKVRTGMHRDYSEHYNTVSMQLARQYGVPVLNLQPLTGLCRWQNCSTDGSHKSRFVNRMKAQLVLNALCKK